MTAKKPRTEVTADVVRRWARKKGFKVGSRGHLPSQVIKLYNQTHRTHFTDRNPLHREEA